MSQQRNQRTYNRTIPAGGQTEIEVQGNMFNVLQSSARFTIEFDESNKFDQVPEGASATFNNEYQRVRLKSAVEQTVVVVLGFGDFKTSTTQSVDTVNATLESPNQSSIGAVALADATVTLLTSAGAGNREVLVSVPSDADSPVLLSESAVGIDNGFLLEAGQGIAIASKSAVYAKSQNGAIVRLNVIINKVV